jgi:protoporphyrinogen oxidase
MAQTAIIIGAGPAGLTAAFELLERTDIQPIILEKTGDIGGLSKTVNYKGNRMDIGGHRFFSKSDRVMDWWLRLMPLEDSAEAPFTITYQQRSREIRPQASASAVSTSAALDGTPPSAARPGTPSASRPPIPSPAAPAGISASDPPAPRDPDNHMLVRRRLSRIYFLHQFFNYPIQLSLDTIRKLGLFRTIGIALSYMKAALFPVRPETSLEDFLINRFGYRLYRLFFSDYTEKVWGIPCSSISAEWGSQRIKGVSFRKALRHALSTLRPRQRRKKDIHQKDTETSLIDRFLYPRLGPGQLWEEAARQVKEKGGRILMHYEIAKIHTEAGRITAVDAIHKVSGETLTLKGDYFFSSMPVKELVAGLQAEIPASVREVAAGLQYRDFITVGILLDHLSWEDPRTHAFRPLNLKDTWIYIQEKEVRVGRLQIYNNWSPALVKDPNTVWIGMEYFCNKGDAFWNLSDEEIKTTAIAELEKIGLARREDALDATVLRMEKTYPAYFGTYDRFPLVREYLDGFPNLFLIGRNGMHKYNNSDHSMLTAMAAVDNICQGITGKANIWSINTEQEYHEENQEETKSQDHGPESKHHNI